jgi:hypothetical protein
MDGAARHEITADVSQSSHRRAAETALLVLALPAAAGLLSACTQVKPQFQSVDRPVPVTLPDFSLTDHNGRCPQDFPGIRSWWCFSASQCPDDIYHRWMWPRSKADGR